MPRGRIEIVLTPSDIEVGPGDDEWADDLELLRRRLSDHDVDLREQRLARPGHKGAVTEIVVALGGSSTVAALLSVLRDWLDGRRTRAVRLTVPGPDPIEVDLRATGVSDDTIREALLAAIERSGRDD